MTRDSHLLPKQWLEKQRRKSTLCGCWHALYHPPCISTACQPSPAPSLLGTQESVCSEGTSAAHLSQVLATPAEKSPSPAHLLPHPGTTKSQGNPQGPQIPCQHLHLPFLQPPWWHGQDTDPQPSLGAQPVVPAAMHSPELSRPSSIL